MTGGYEVSAALMARGLADRGHQVEVLVSRFGTTAAGHSDGANRNLHRIVDSPVPSTLLRLEWTDRRIVEKALRRFRPDLVSAWNLEGLFPSVLQAIVGGRVPSVFHLHDVYFHHISRWARDWHDFWRRPASGNKLRAAAKAAMRRVGASADLASGWPQSVRDIPLLNAVYCSDFIRRENEAHGIIAGRTRVILSGVDTGRFNPAGRSHAPTLRLLFAGRFHESKGAHLAIEALESMVGSGLDATLTLVGATPPDRSYYDGLVARASAPALTGRVQFRGLVDAADMPRLYGEHDVLLNPTTHLEGLPRSAMESMASGCVVVGYATGGGAELFQDDVNAVVVASEGACALASEVHRLADDRPRLARLSRDGARLIAERHSITRVVEETESFYKNLLASPR